MLSERPRIVITGASGLLGSYLYKRLKGIASVVGTCFTNSQKDKSLLQINLLDFPKFQQVIDSFKPVIIIHCAADLRCIDNTKAWAINVDFTRQPAELAAQSHAYLTFLSSTYVYDGILPPFEEERAPNPLNFYGRSKYHAEMAISALDGQYLILRIPLLFGVEGLDSVAMLVKAINNSEPCTFDDHQIRFPTSADNVAEAIEIIVREYLNETPVLGIYNFGSHNGITKYQMCQILGAKLKKSIDHIIRSELPSEGRPKNCLMSTDKIKSAGINLQLLDFQTWIQNHPDL